MSEIHKSPPDRDLGDFSDVLEICDRENLGAVLVGGSAVACWCLYYRDQIAGLTPNTTKDLDLLGEPETALRLAQLLGGEFIPSPRKGGASNVIGRILLDGRDHPLKSRRMLEFLWSVRGASSEVIAEGAISLPIQLPSRPVFRVRVIDPVTLLEAKLANVVEIEQSERNDLDHLHSVMRIVPRFLLDFYSGKDRKRLLERVLRIGLSNHSRRARRHVGIRFEVMVGDFTKISADANTPLEQSFLSKRLPRWLDELGA